MLLHEMNYVYEVYRQRSFTKAAQALYIAQPSLSQMVRKAEARIGAPIFDRSTSPIGVTELGRAYIRAAEQVLQIEADLQQYLDDTEKCLTGALTLEGRRSSPPMCCRRWSALIRSVIPAWSCVCTRLTPGSSSRNCRRERWTLL